MNQGQFKDPLCYLCLCGSVVSSLSLVQEAVSLSTAIFLIFEKKLSLNSGKTQIVQAHLILLRWAGNETKLATK